MNQLRATSSAQFKVLKRLVRTVASRDTKVLLDGFVVHFLTIMIRRNPETTLRVCLLWRLRQKRVRFASPTEQAPDHEPYQAHSGARGATDKQVIDSP